MAGALAALTGGNPLALVELTGSLTDAQRAAPSPWSSRSRPAAGRSTCSASGWNSCPARPPRAPDRAAAGSDEMVPVARALAVEQLGVSALEPAELAA